MEGGTVMTAQVGFQRASPVAVKRVQTAAEHEEEEETHA
jgi:hypothetical protein